MAHVPKHDSEEEGEGDDGVGRCGRGTCSQLGPHRPTHLSVQDAMEARTWALGEHTSSKTQCGQTEHTSSSLWSAARCLPHLKTVHLPNTAPSLIPILQVRPLRLREVKMLAEASKSNLEPGHSPAEPPLLTQLLLAPL